MLLNVVEIEKYYGTRNNLKKALDRVSFSVNSGDFVSIMGASGSGKTTLGRAIMRINPCSNGEILFEGKRISGKMIGRAHV